MRALPISKVAQLKQEHKCFKWNCRVFAYWFPLWQGGIFPFTVAPLQHPTLVFVELFSEGAEERSCLLYTSQFNSPGARGIEEVWNRLMKEENRQEHVGRWLMTTRLNRNLEYTGVGERKIPSACVCVNFVWVFKERGGVRQDLKRAVSQSTPALPPIHILCCSLSNIHTKFVPHSIRAWSALSQTLTLNFHWGGSLSNILICTL